MYKRRARVPAAPIAGLDNLLSGQLAVLEAQLDRQEPAMAGRFANTNTRAAVLIGASGALGGTELVTASGDPLISCASLVLYLVAALCGLAAMRSRLARQPDLRTLVSEYADAATISMRQSLLSSRLDCMEVSRVRLLSRHRWLGWGFSFLVFAWVASGAGTVIGLLHAADLPPQ